MYKNLRWKIAQNAELRWWRNYLNTKPSPRYLNWKKKYWIDFLDQIQSGDFLYSSSRILEAGCGPAGLFMVLGQYEIIAIDPLLSKYKSKTCHFDPGKYPSVKFLERSIEDVELEEFDIIFCVNVINHVKDIKQSLRKLNSHLVDGGILILSVDVHNYSWVKQLFRTLQFDILHPHQYDLNEYKQMIGTYCEIEFCKRLKKRLIFDYYVIKARKISLSDREEYQRQ